MNLTLSSVDPTDLPSAYFSRAYGEANVAGSDAMWIQLSAFDGSWQMPLILEPHSQGGFDASSPYGYSGIHISEDLSSRDSQKMWTAAINTLRELGVITTFLRYAPFEHGSVERSRTLAGVTLKHISDTVLVPVESPDTMWDAMQGRSRTAIRKAERVGLRGVVEPVSERLLLKGSAFQGLYGATMARIGAADHHTYTDAYYQRLLDGIPESIRVVSVIDPDGETVASSLLLVDQEVVHYHLSGSDPVHARNGANNLLLWTMLKWATDAERRQVHLGGGTAPDDSLFKFKQSLGGIRVPFTVGNVIVDEARHDELVRDRADELGVTVDELRAVGRFPAYQTIVVSNATN